MMFFSEKDLNCDEKVNKGIMRADISEEMKG
jgi:hypothetical protein